MKYALSEYKSPVGILYLVSDGDKLNGCYFSKGWEKVCDSFELSAGANRKVIEETSRQLDSYFSGER